MKDDADDEEERLTNEIGKDKTSVQIERRREMSMREESLMSLASSV